MLTTCIFNVFVTSIYEGVSSRLPSGSVFFYLPHLYHFNNKQKTKGGTIMSVTISNDTIRKLKDVYRLSNAEMGYLTDLSQEYIRKLTVDERRVTPRVAQRIIDAFELDAEKLAKIYEIYEEYRISVTSVS